MLMPSFVSVNGFEHGIPPRTSHLFRYLWLTLHRFKSPRGYTNYGVFVLLLSLMNTVDGAWNALKLALKLASLIFSRKKFRRQRSRSVPKKFCLQWIVRRYTAHFRKSWRSVQVLTGSTTDPLLRIAMEIVWTHQIRHLWFDEFSLFLSLKAVPSSGCQAVMPLNFIIQRVIDRNIDHDVPPLNFFHSLP